MEKIFCRFFNCVDEIETFAKLKGPLCLVAEQSWRCGQIFLLWSRTSGINIMVRLPLQRRPQYSGEEGGWDARGR